MSNLSIWHPLCWAVVCLGLFGLSAAGFAKPVQITVQEQLNQTYARELVQYPFTAEQGACVATSLLANGPRGLVPAQLTEITTWSAKDASVKSARLALLLDGLAPLATDTYSVSYGKSPVPALATDLHIAPGKDSIEVTTSHLGVRLLSGEKTMTPPVAAKDVPGPLQAMRLENGTWAGGSSLSGDVPVTAWSAKLTAAGPVFARVETRYTFADGNVLTLSATVVAGDSAVRWEMLSAVDRPTHGIEFRLSPMPGVKQAILPKGYGQWAKGDRTIPVAVSDKPLCFLSPDSSLLNIFPEDPSAVRLAASAGPELQLRSRDPGAWVDSVAPYTYGGVKSWYLDAIPAMWENWKRKRMPVGYAADGTVTLQATLAKGQRKWSVSAGAPLVGEKLDVVKEMVLDWPEKPGLQFPHLFVSKQDVADTWARAATDPDLMAHISRGGAYAGGALAAYLRPVEKQTKAEQARTVNALRDEMALMGNTDLMRQAIGIATHYDALIDSGLLTPADRKLFRAQMAYLAYKMADPQCWSPERGYNSGNPNMSCSYICSLGVIGCLISDHPLAKQWTNYCNNWMENWLTNEVGPNGEWLPEGSHYSHVSLAPMLVYAITAERAGVHDYVSDPRLKKLILYFVKHYTPRDPQRHDHRVSPAFGRGTSGDTEADFGIAARMYAKKDPELSRTCQWLWAEMGYPGEIGDSRQGGFEPYYLDKRLPMQQPAWNSELFPALGPVLRAGFGTPNESYVHAISCQDSKRNLDIWTPEIGGIDQWYGRGKPLSTCFSFAVGYNERHELLRNGVRLTHNYDGVANTKIPFGYYTTPEFGGFAALPTADYMRSTFVNTAVDDRDWFPDKMPAFPRVTPAKSSNLTWTRQMLFMKDDDPAGPAYLVQRDTTRGGEPTAWQFWTLSEKIGTPAQAQEVNFLAEKPGKTILPARELPLSDRYTAIGQQGMDVEYYIAAPSNTPRHTLRYGGIWSGVPEFQDLLHLQLPGDGVYYVALFPHPHTEAAPTFATLDNGKLIKVAGTFGTDYLLLASEETTASADGITFRGTAGSVQQRPNSQTLSLGAAGEVHQAQYGLSAPSAASLRIQPALLTLSRPADAAAGVITLTAPTGWKLATTPAGVKMAVKGTTYQLTLPQGIGSVTLAKTR